ncbi:deoxyuridine 5'-triphosphate nucleotidohydrolase [Candidatus Nanohalobium constans]|uniref:dUTP pyrophosphatase n=1 Tax=Candidatus Nanohalobium constans TaxID=2565781 RepID=A0A5Q0UGF8_9ARCH|nr:deoxyuridine 5'-triphosphate nucleotidohydrolase [Candidatus Nanohalobium constans]QGA80079.1 dUTP pyrophosphatase [Candidatus Nanohalobium constans]
MTINKTQLKERIKEDDLINNFIDLENQLQPAGFDVTAAEVHRFEEAGQLDFSNSEREIPDTEEVKPVKKDEEDDYGWWNLEPGAYKVVMNERVDIPENFIGVAHPRSSLLRMGCTIGNALWEPGYTGPGEFVLIVQNPEGVEIKENARVNQLTFEEIDETEGYDGVYHEG